MSNEIRGQICFKRYVGDIAHKCDADDIVFKTQSTQLGAALIIISWPEDNKDLDIMGFWDGNEEGAVGWSYASHADPPYKADYSGDDTSEGGTETISVLLTDNNGNPNWDFHGVRNFIVHLNYYGEVKGSAVCTVTVEKENKTITLTDVACGVNTGKRASTSDPGIVAKFNDIGELLSLEVL